MGRIYSEHEQIEKDIEDIFDFVASDSPAYAEKVVHAIYETLGHIESEPERFPRCTPAQFGNDLRRVVVRPYSNYLVFFDLTDEKIRVLYVHHRAREFEERHLQEKRS